MALAVVALVLIVALFVAMSDWALELFAQSQRERWHR